MTIAVVLSPGRARADIGLDDGHLSRQHCEGSRQTADKLLIKPRQVGQVGVGSPRNRSNARHTEQGGQYSREAPQAADSSLPIRHSGGISRLTVFSYGWLT